MAYNDAAIIREQYDEAIIWLTSQPLGKPVSMAQCPIKHRYTLEAFTRFALPRYTYPFSNGQLVRCKPRLNGAEKRMDGYKLIK